MDEISVAAELLGIKSWLEFYGKDFFPEGLFDDLCDKIRQCEEIAFKNNELVSVLLCYLLNL